MKYIADTLRNSERTSRIQILFWALILTIVCVSGLYIYFVNKIVWNVVARQNIENNIASLNSSLSDTEFQYINSVSAITMDTATKLGFVSAGDSTTFVATEEIGKSVAIR